MREHPGPALAAVQTAGCGDDGICPGLTDCGGTCADLDHDPCLDWSVPEPCGDGRACEDGACVEARRLEESDDCVGGENQCCGGHCRPFFFI